MKLPRTLLAGVTALTLLAVPALASVAHADEARIVLAPPALQVEVRGPRPGPYHSWQSGSWAWNPEGRYVWHPGHWVVPPPGKAVWVPNEWVRAGGGWQLVPGHWHAEGERIPTLAQRTMVVTEPPPEKEEVVLEAPAGHAWVHGHWSWDGAAYVWVPGHLMRAPEGFHTWERGHWYANGGHWYYRGGYWH